MASDAQLLLMEKNVEARLTAKFEGQVKDLQDQLAESDKKAAATEEMAKRGAEDRAEHHFQALITANPMLAVASTIGDGPLRTDAQRIALIGATVEASIVLFLCVEDEHAPAGRMFICNKLAEVAKLAGLLTAGKKVADGSGVKRKWEVDRRYVSDLFPRITDDDEKWASKKMYQVDAKTSAAAIAAVEKGEAAEKKDKADREDKKVASHKYPQQYSSQGHSQPHKPYNNSNHQGGGGGYRRKDYS